LIDPETAGATQPDKKQLRFNMKKGANDDWNAAVLCILVKRVEKAHRNAYLPHRPHDYFVDVVQEKFEHARAHWRKGQQRLTDMDVLEMAEEVAAHVETTKERELVRARDTERRSSVK
jgi:hypothetical protein